MASTQRRKHVVVVGAGAAGMACAATLAQHPDKFRVTVLEKGSVAGGQATSISLDESRFGASWMNNGVQGGSLIFKHTFNFFRKYGHEPREVQLQVSFGKGPEGFWTNCFPSKLVAQFAPDIRRFGTFLRLVRWTMPVLGLVPIRLMLRLMFFSRGFGDRMVYPLIALFLGTGNQTPNVPCAIVERLFDDPNMKLWDYDPETLLPNRPTMLTFGNLHDFYEDWRQDLVHRGVAVRLNTEVVRVESRSNSGGVVLQTRPVPSGPRSEPEPEPAREHFDELVLCVLADDALRLLGNAATARERFVLGGARFYDDVTVTHCDSAYFRRHYETAFDPSLCAEQSPSQASGQDEEGTAASASAPAAAAADFRPMYFTKSYPQDMGKIEMSFDCSNYQHQFPASGGGGGEGEPGLEHVYQTIFLDQRGSSHLWTSGEIAADKVIRRDAWHQLGHRWQHYLRVVPGMMFLNGRKRTLFAGSWTLVNMHELAIISGIAAAYRLGADYTAFDAFAEDFFAKYLLLSHGAVYSWEEKRRKRREKRKGD